ncbi:tetratricopeptide repeat-containing serine/threonine-protein kinase [Streptomyces caatingaensis]|uniref:non-specific serine/threonine protein kinase n=1 Tax=Streptomyces caatingaensis TaxID=1678637 RepID=A0A0K9XFW9_9ACTN|nr:tetratricopeptide repeat-containing serine/threonine-protein kinase [Streptomyces caatingaensis]KNB52304.1 serine/threonine protein kinase [Streptomyces caatingaensis]
MAETRLIQGRYQLLDRIGRGGMGEVWRARDESLGRHVAVKCLKPLGPQHEPSYLRVLRERFRREARVAASLQHRGITVVHDFGESDGVLYLVMELLDGRNLSQLLEDNKQHPLPVPEVVEIAEQVGAALAYTHRQGIVHRDLKPANIMRLTDGTVKICDFGIARLGHDIGFTARLTGTGIAMGTPHYMSPEQIGAGSVDHRSDLYSLGCVLYEIATGAPPFDMDDAWAVLVGHRDTAPRPPRELRPELPEEFERVVLDLLAKDPDDRPDDATELVRRVTGTWPRREAGLAARSPMSLSDGVPRPPRETVSRPDGQPRLPAWARHMTTGSKAAGTGPVPAAPPDPAASLTGSWTTPWGRHGDGPLAPFEPPVPVGPAGPGTAARTPAPGGADTGRPRTVPERRTAVSARTAPGATAVRHGASLAGAPPAPVPRPSVPHPAHAVDPRRPAPRTAGAERPPPAAPPSPEQLADLAARHSGGLRLGRAGRWAEAGEAHRAVVAERERLLGPDHPDTLASRYEVAFSLSRLGRPEEALREFVRTAAARSRVLGADHPDTLAARQETAYVLGQLGRHFEAREVYADVLAARERIMGPDHPDTLRCGHNLAFSLSRLGRLEDSYRMARDVAAARARVLGPDHPDTLVTRYEVAYALGQLERWEEALRTYREVAASRARVLGADHPDTLAARYEAGICLGRLGRSAEALELYRTLIEDRTRVQGPAHPDTLRARHGLGVNLGRLGRWEEALAEARDVCAIRARVLGADHPDTLVSRREVAVGLGWLGRWTDALAVYRDVAQARQRVLGADHPDALASRNDEAHCLEQLGRTAEAAELYRQVAALRQTRNARR